MVKPTFRHVHHGGFSLVEMLVVIAVIGIIAGIVIPNIGKIRDSAKDGNLRRNAQNLASVYVAAQVAGHDFAYSDGISSGDLLSESETILAIIEGVEIGGKGPLQGTFLGVQGLDTSLAVDNENGAAKYLILDVARGGLLYSGD